MTKNHCEPGTYRNTTETQIRPFRDFSLNITTGKNYGDIGYQTNSSNIQLFSSILEGLNPSTQGYQDLTPLECSIVYQTYYVPNRRNVFLITKHNSNTPYDNTILAMKFSNLMSPTPFVWICTPGQGNRELNERASVADEAPNSGRGRNSRMQE